MRIDVVSNDKPGVTSKILNVLTKAGCDLIAVEMTRNHTYVNFKVSDHRFTQIKKTLKDELAEDFIDVSPIDMLPAEVRENHLNVLLDGLQDPVFDIDSNGVIIVANAVAANACNTNIDSLEGQNLSAHIDAPIATLLQRKSNNTEIHLHGQPFNVEIRPVTTSNKVTGAIIVLNSPQRMGRKLSAMRRNHNDNIRDIIGQSPAMKAVMNKTVRFGKLDMPILINGETGTGKELLAKALHHQGCDADAPFLAINCATLAENLLESELFGYAPGAFSGAQRGGKPGLLELASGGSVFLDEIGEMSIYLQAKLLRFLQDYTFRRVGGTKEITVKVRVISATHRDLETMAQRGEFREDLFYRLNVLNIEIPPLRDRASDIPLLVEHFTARAATQIAQTQPKITKQAMKLLCQFSWPGNIRQLENLLFRSIALLDGNILDTEALQLPQIDTQRTQHNQTNEVQDWQSAQQQFEKALLNQLYPQYPSTRKLAKRLGVSHNKIAMKLKEHDINNPSSG